MRFLSRKTRTVTRPHSCEHAYRATRAVQSAYDERIARREQAEQDKADLIARVTRRYYHANALSVSGNRHQTDVAQGIMNALAEITGMNAITVGYRLDHGLSLTDLSEFCVVDNNGTLPVILRKGTEVREPVADRLDRLRAEALKADNHPLYEHLYGDNGQAYLARAST